MAGEVLRELWVSLGFETNHTEERRLLDTVDRVSNAVLAITGVLAGMALGAAVATVKTADSFSTLYYSAQRAGTSVQTLKEIGYAFKQVGGDGDAATASFIKFSENFKSNPAFRANVAKLFGIDVSGDDVGKMFFNLQKKIKELNGKGEFYQALNFGKAVGLDDATVYSFTKNIDAQRDAFRKMVQDSGVDLDDIAEKSARFTNKVDEGFQAVGLIKDKVFGDLMTKYGPDLEQLIDYLVKHVPEISKSIEDTTEKMLGYGHAIDGAITKTIGWGAAAKITAGLIAFAFAPILTTVALVIYALEQLDKYNNGFLSTGATGSLEDKAKYNKAEAARAAKDPNYKPLYLNARDADAHKNFRPGLDNDPFYPTDGSAPRTDVNNPVSTTGPTPQDQRAKREKSPFPKLTGDNAADMAALQAWEDDNLDKPARDIAMENLAQKSEREFFSRVKQMNANIGAGGTGGSVTLNQQNDIHVNGTDHPQTVANGVLAGQARMTQDAARHLQSVAR